jgi:uncharacterized membrane protein
MGAPASTNMAHRMFGLAAIVLRRSCCAALPCAGEGGVIILFRTIFIAGLGLLVLLPLLSMNNTMNALLGRADAAPRGWTARVEQDGGTVMARLGVLKTEIHADMCSRGPQHYCVGGMCVSLPQGGCGR